MDVAASQGSRRTPVKWCATAMVPYLEMMTLPLPRPSISDPAKLSHPREVERSVPRRSDRATGTRSACSLPSGANEDELKRTDRTCARSSTEAAEFATHEPEPDSRPSLDRLALNQDSDFRTACRSRF